MGNEEKKLLLDLLPKKKRLDPVKNWKPDQVFEWFERLADGKFRDVAENIPSNFTGQMLVRLSENRCVQLCGGSERRGRQLFDLLHQEMQRIEAERKRH